MYDGNDNVIINTKASSFDKEKIIRNGSDTMATTKNYKDFIIEQLSLLDRITYKSMMGEYLLYYNSQLFGGIYDNRLLIKIVDTNKKYKMEKTMPYEGAKPMYFVNDVDNKEMLKSIIIDTCRGLKKQK